MATTEIADFLLPATGGATFQLHATRGKSLVIFFYPKDNTPGCITESQQFRDLYDEFKKAHCTVVGISRDSMISHEKFKAAYNLPYALLSDCDEKVCEQFGVMKLKNNFGKQVRGIERSTFVLNTENILTKEWRGLKADGHAQQVLDFVRTINP